MTTVIQIINLALRDIAVLGKAESADASDTSDCLATLNQMIGQWRVDKLYVHAQKVVSFEATGAQTYTIGDTGTIDVPLPPSIDSAAWRSGGTDCPLYVLTSLQDFERICTKSLTGDPSTIFYQRTYPLGVIHVWPQPSTGSIRLITREELAGYDSVAADMTIPDEYLLALRYSLAELIAPMFGVSAPMHVMQLAANARRVMKRNNVKIPLLQMPGAVQQGHHYDINRG